MLISCPKCQSIYEIPDNLIGKTGKNFRCQACSNVWHAVREDALGYEKETAEPPYIEAIELKEKDARAYPANKKEFLIPADTKSGKKTRSSQEIIKNEGNLKNIPPLKNKNEITLTSDSGASFTISMPPEYIEEEEKKTPHLFNDSDSPEKLSLNITKKDRLLTEKAPQSSKTLPLILLIIALILALFFLRREIVAFYPEAEVYYNKAGISATSNPGYLKFKNIKISEDKETNALIIAADIINDSRYIADVPDVTVSGSGKTFSPSASRLMPKETASVEISLTKPAQNTAQTLILGFHKP